MDRNRKDLIERFLIVLGAVLAFGMLDSLYAERDAKITTQAEKKAAQAKRDVHPAMLVPLDCTARVAQRGANENWVTFCYNPKSAP